MTTSNYPPERTGLLLVEQTKLVASDIRGQVVAGAGHWLMEEAPQTVIPALTEFIDGVRG